MRPFRELMNERQDLMDAERELRYKRDKIEHDIKGRLIKSGKTDLLKVDWTRLARESR